MNQTLLRLVDHMRWADNLVADALEANPDPESVRLFAHIASVENLWYARIHGHTPRHAIWPNLTPRESRTLAAEHADLFASLIRENDETGLARIVDYRNTAGKDYSNSVTDIVTHTCVHGEHHRGQIARLLRAAGCQPPYTDFIQYTREDQD